MKYKIKDLDDIDTELFNSLEFNNLEEIETFLREEYCAEQQFIKEVVMKLSLNNTLGYLNLEVIECG